MNLLLFSADKRMSDGFIEVEEYQHQHLLNILKLKVGDTLRVAEENGNMGIAQVVQLDKTVCNLKLLSLQEAPPAQANISLIVALPRPQMIKRILQTVACLGVKELNFIQTSKVEKSFWQSPVLKKEEIYRQLKLGLEQAMATQFPSVHFYPRFTPFIEDTLSTLSEGKKAYIATPGQHAGLSSLTAERECLLAIGPEGGFIEKEVHAFKQCGFNPVSLGQRILKVETAVTAIAAYFLCLS